MKKMLPVIIVLLIVVGGISFYGGMKYAENKKVASFAMNRNGAVGMVNGGRRGGMGNFRGGAGGFANGEIISNDSSSITIKLRDGGSQIVFFSTSTQVMKSIAGSVEDLKTGENVMINGSANADGSVTAQNIQLRSAVATSSAK